MAILLGFGTLCSNMQKKMRTQICPQEVFSVISKRDEEEHKLQEAEERVGKPKEVHKSSQEKIKCIHKNIMKEIRLQF